MKIENFNIVNENGKHFIYCNETLFSSKDNIKDAIILANLLNEAYKFGYRTGFHYRSEPEYKW